MILNNKELYDYLTELLKEEILPFLNAEPEKRSIRLNTLKIDSINQSPFLQSHKDYLKRLAFADYGYAILNDNIPFSFSMDFFRGNFAFQGASSQIPPIVLNPKPGEVVLDMTAAPGSKTTQIAALMQNKGELIVNDSNINRMQALNINTQRSAMTNHCVYYLAGERFGRLFPEYFDRVLLDAPCSGLGTLATHKEVYSWWSYEKLRKLAALQKQLLISAIKTTKVDGEIVYSTCSIAPEENELVLNDILKSYPVEIAPIKNKKLDFLDDGYIEYKGEKLDPTLKNTKRVWPHKHAMEGFFIARLIKKGTYYNKNSFKKVEYQKTLSCDNPILKEILLGISDSWGIEKSTWRNHRFIKTRDRIWLFNEEIEDIVKEGFTNGGLLLAEKRLQIWKLSNQSAQFFADKIRNRIINLPDNEVKELFEKGKCFSAIRENGYFALQIKGLVLAIVFINDGMVKIKTPHSFNYNTSY